MTEPLKKHGRSYHAFNPELNDQIESRMYGFAPDEEVKPVPNVDRILEESMEDDPLVESNLLKPSGTRYNSVEEMVEKECPEIKGLLVTRKDHPVYSGALKYFPDALMAVAHCSKVGNDQHNPGEALNWSREKSSDHLDSLTRHLLEVGTMDSDGVRHSTKVAWRALANLQLELEASNGH